MPTKELRNLLGEAATDRAAKALHAAHVHVWPSADIETCKRWVRAIDEMTAGEGVDPVSLLKVFEAPTDDLVVLRGVRFTSVCEHHLLPFVGTADVGYVPGPITPHGPYRVCGLSKLARVVDCVARRRQLQERMTYEIADALRRGLEPRGVGVRVRASHSCMGCRGARQPDALMVTSHVTGIMRESVRDEWMHLIGP